MKNEGSILKIKFADIFIFLSLFPFVNFNLTSFDTQPFTFLVGLIGLSLSLCRFYINKMFRASFVLVLIALFISSFSLLFGDSSYGLIGARTGVVRYVLERGIYNYLSFFFYLFIFSYFYRNNLVNIKLVIFANYTYIFFGFLQIFFHPIIYLFVSSRVAGFDDGRGLTSLTPEPTHLGFMFIFFSILLLINSGYKLNKNIFLHSINFLSIFAVIRSGSIIFILMTSFLIGVIFNIKKIFKKKYLNQFLTVFFAFILGIVYSIKYETRIYRIFNKLDFNNLSDGLILIINTDLSISERLQHLLIPFIAFFRDLGIPHSFNSLYKSAEIINTELNLFQNSTASFKIMSFMGDWIYSLGIFGVISFLLIFVPIVIKNKVPNYILILFITTLITSVPISLPLVPAIIAGFYYQNDNLFSTNEET